MPNRLPVMHADLNTVTKIRKGIFQEQHGILECSFFNDIFGKTVAIKGIGGYYLMCDALNNEAVLRLRQRKQRDAKPLAVMFRNLAEVNEYCYINSLKRKN